MSYLYDIINAILKHNVIEFVYYNSYGEEKKRQAEPLQIYFKDKSWYLKAYKKENSEQEQLTFI